ncbi:hypothetical protein J6590_100339 [Homalodisca vitripennis]|nr:hypothetical protein J6590_100339 [Homalodisca vitripennis]
MYKTIHALQKTTRNGTRRHVIWLSLPGCLMGGPAEGSRSPNYPTNTAKYKIIQSEKVSALCCNGSTFTRQVRDPGSTPGGARGVGSHRPQRKQRGRHQKKTLSAEGKIIRRSPRDGGKKASKVLGFDMNFNSEKTEVRGRSVNNRSQAEDVSLGIKAQYSSQWVNSEGDIEKAVRAIVGIAQAHYK